MSKIYRHICLYVLIMGYWYGSEIYYHICWYVLMMWHWLVSKTQSYMFTDIDCAICWLIWDWQVLNLYEKCDWHICWMIWNWYDDWKRDCCTYDDDVLGTIWKYMCCMCYWYELWVTPVYVLICEICAIDMNMWNMCNWYEWDVMLETYEWDVTLELYE